MNRTVIFITFTILVVLALVGTFLLLIIAPQHIGTFTGYILVLLGLASTFATTVWSLGKTKQEVENIKRDTNSKLDVVQKQTNGTLSNLIESVEAKTKTIHARDAEIAQLRAMLQLPAMEGKIRE